MGTGTKHLLNDTISKILFDNYKQRDFQESIECLRCPIQARKIADIEGSGIFDLEENKVNTINNNISQWVEEEEDLEEAEATEGAETQEDADVAMKAEDFMLLPERRKQSWVIKIPRNFYVYIRGKEPC